MIIRYRFYISPCCVIISSLDQPYQQHHSPVLDLSPLILSTIQVVWCQDCMELGLRSGDCCVFWNNLGFLEFNFQYVERAAN